MVILLAKEHQRKIKRVISKNTEKAQQLKEILYDFPRFCEKFLKIKTKTGEIKPLLLNKAQLKLAEVIFGDLAAGKPVRIIILKARQMGFSTTAEAIIYYLASTQVAKNGFIVAQDSSATGNLYDMFKLYHEYVPEVIKPMQKRNNSKQLTFENPSRREVERLKNPGLKSKITVQSAEKKVLARSETIHFLHVSELAFWPKNKKKTHLTALFAALSKEPGTVGIIESTANGMEEYKDMWEKACAGENEWVPLFFPWFQMPDYRKPVPDDFVLTDEEIELKNKFSLDDEQLMWRRYTIRNDCNGDVRQFRQEYPSDPEEAFLLSGEGIFDNEYIKKLLEPMKKVQYSQHDIDTVKKTIAPGNKIKIFKQPEKGKCYVIGADTAKGTTKGDYDVAYVLEERSGEMVAVIRGKWDTDIFGKKLDALGRYYNTALLAVENNNTGESVLNTLKNVCNYPLLYYWKKGDPGWNTNSATRPVMISDFIEALRDQLFEIYDEQLYKECLTFIDNKGKAEADSGCNDDCIMAYAITLRVRQVARRWFDWYHKKNGGRSSGGTRIIG